MMVNKNSNNNYRIYFTKRFKRIFFCLALCILTFILLDLIARLKRIMTFKDVEPSVCLTNSSSFLMALEAQSHGLDVVRFNNETLNPKRTLMKLPQHFNNIWNATMENLDILQFLAEENEIKYFIKFGKHLSKPYKCRVVTMGVGHLIWAEGNLSKVYPECQFLAADPSSEINEKLVQDGLHGIFLKAAVGGESKKTEQNVLDGDRLYRTKFEQQLSLFDFLWNYNGQSPIDLLLIDTEGAEFGILEKLVDDFDQLPVPVCQINIEFHHFYQLVDEIMQLRFFRYLDRLVRSKKFALMHVDVHPDRPFHRMFFTNIVDDVCISKFLCM